MCVMASQPWFKDWFNSPYYHQPYFNRDEQEAAVFIDKLIERLHPAAMARMLDVACGKGRHSIHLAQKGFDVTGIDTDIRNIEYLRPFFKNVEFVVHAAGKVKKGIPLYLVQ